MFDAISRTYLGYDLGLESEFALPGAGVLESGLAVDIRITTSFLQAPQMFGRYSHSDGKILGSSRGIAIFSCSIDGRIEVCSAASCDAASVGQLIIASALPATLWMRGEIVLHGAVAALGGSGRAIAISGASGTGKSTVLEQLLDRGAQVVSDDTARVVPRANDWFASGLPGGYFAPAPPGGILQERTFVAVAPDRRLPTAPLGVLLELVRGEPTEPAHFQELHGADALAALLRARHRPMIPSLLGTEARHLGDFAALSQAITVFRWVRPEGGVALTGYEYNRLRNICAKGPPRGTT